MALKNSVVNTHFTIINCSHRVALESFARIVNRFTAGVSYDRLLRTTPAAQTNACIVPSQCLQRLGSGGASSSPSSRCRTGMAAHPAPAPPPPLRQYGACALHLDRSSSGGGVAAATEPDARRPPRPVGGAHFKLFWAAVTHGPNCSRERRSRF